jgi:DNA-binding CsgD family transcriptional regulator/tetratricopeptide (TPR) repeat protein
VSRSEARGDPAEWQFVARTEEAAFLRTCRDDPEVPGVIVTGGAGVGKSRLVREALGGEGVTFAVATRAAATIPFGCLAQLVPDSSPDLPADRVSLFNTVAAAFRATSEERPVLIVDDAHLLDPAGAALVFHLANVGAGFVCAVVRNGEPIPDAIQALWKDAGAARIEVEPLSAEAAGDLVRRVLGGQVDQASQEALWEMAGGNVLLMRELIDASLDRGELRQSEGVWRWTGEVPVSVPLLEMVENRIGNLAVPERRVLETLALGEPLSAQLLEELTGAEPLAEVERRGLVTVSGEGAEEEARLSHPLYAEVVRSRVPSTEARAIRRALAAGVEQGGLDRPGDVLRVATWRLDADGTGDPDLFTDAAVRAARSFDPELAARLAGAAERAGGGLGAALARGEALIMQNRFEEAEDALAPYEEAAPTSGHGRHYLFQRTLALHWGLGRSREADEHLRAARPARDDEVWHQQVDGLRAEVLAFDGPLDEALQLAEPLVADAGADPWARLFCVSAVATALTFSGRTDTALKTLEPFVVLALEHSTGFPLGPAWITAQQAAALTYAGRLDEVETVLHALLTIAGSVRDEQSRGGALMGLGIVAAQRGDIGTARRSLREAIGPLWQSDLAGLLPWTYSVLARIEGESGDAAAARSAARSAADLATSRPRNRLYVYDQVRGEAWTAAASGEFSRARQIALDGAAELAELAVHEALLLVTALRLGAPYREVAPRLIEVCAESESQLLTTFGRLGAALHSGAGTEIEAAARGIEEVGMMLLAAETHASAAAAFREEGRADSARRAAARAGALGEERCAGARTPGLATTSGPDLTPRQREIATLAAGGLSNAEIAARLTVSVRTVEWHLQQVYTELGTGSREELAELLAG